MPKYTENLNLFKYDVPNDGNRPFDIETSLNENWDKIDTFSQENNLQNKITNCVLEIPSRIKFVSSNTSATLQGGTIVTVPYGTSAPNFNIGDFITSNFKIVDYTYTEGKLFYYCEVQTDITSSETISDDNVRAASVNLTANTINAYFVTGSGSSGYSGNANCVYYNTTTNRMVYYASGSARSDIIAFPIGRVQRSYNLLLGGINQIFNGFGYIGSTVWIDKGVKFLIPNGRNEDGSLKNIEYITTKCTTYSTFTGDTHKRTLFRFLENGELGSGIFGVINDIMAERVYIQETPPTIINTQLWYKPSENQYYGVKNGTTWQKVYPAIISLGIQASSDRISSVTFYQPVNLVKKSDSSWLSGLGMPSDKYINLSLGANGASYTAPANGWFWGYGTSTGSAYINFSNEAKYIAMSNTTPYSSTPCSVLFPVSSGDVVKFYYQGVTGVTIRFIYVNGEE